MISNKENKKKMSGFTIVELLIVIVVIGILAAITIVAYNGIQQRASTAAAESLANDAAKKAQAWSAAKSVFPTIAELQAGHADAPEAKLEGKLAKTGALVATPAPTADNGKDTVQYVLCGTAPNYTGVTITWWDFAKEAVTTTPKVAGVCP